MMSKSMELAGVGSDELSDPEEVKIAREELKVLHDEKHRTEKIRSTVYKELEQAKLKTRKLEEVRALYWLFTWRGQNCIFSSDPLPSRKWKKNYIHYLPNSCSWQNYIS